MAVAPNGEGRVVRDIVQGHPPPVMSSVIHATTATMAKFGAASWGCVPRVTQPRVSVQYDHEELDQPQEGLELVEELDERSPRTNALLARGPLVVARMAFALLGFSALVTEIATLVARGPTD